MSIAGFKSSVLLFIFYLRMLLLLVLLQICAGHWLLAHITQCDVSSTVDLMGGEIGLRNIMLAKTGLGDEWKPIRY